MKTREELMQEIIEEVHSKWIQYGDEKMHVVEDVIRWCRSDADLARYVRSRMNEIIRVAEKHGD